ncbi:pantetheine-phosphate adenylyltransferase [Tengunoibacter tsumagoiensis]|uniref:Phosphopantetheine adenylyltransferase n=1 Tax=Tengunoibacter tsumagoiensis TaxID=2014871 RepID=A0A402A4R9_9CHLR|nr:pantetheine-phosphate adenylyltransferase [Tengunoibacter tsumagoiensis]GCE14001.1 phosphopantetheine adenylyltransferase [Tengunoibacter tsumagoiensis]
MKHQQRSQLIGIYPGSFDPLTNGHLDIARRAAQLCERLVIAVYATPSKNLLFTVEERAALWQKVIAEEQLVNVQVETFTGLTIDYARARGATAIIKGLRSSADFEAEFKQGLMNRKLAPEIETICLFTHLEHLFISSSLLKEVARLGGDVTDLLPTTVARALQQKLHGEPR